MLNKYYTSENNFMVEDHGDRVIVYAMGKKIKEIPYQEIHFGKPSKKIKNYNYTKGNSILLQINKGVYVFIGNTIYKFTINDKKIKFISPIGNSGISYPYIVGDTHTYLLLEKVYLDNNDIDLTEDIYGQYYRPLYIKLQLNNKKLPKTKKDELLQQLKIYTKITNSAKKIKTK